MARPIYETDTDLRAEAAVAAAFEERFSMRLKKLPRSYYVDYMAFDFSAKAENPPPNNGCAWIEVKCRSHDMGTYDTFFISALKWSHGTALARNTGLPFIIVVGFTNCVAWYQYDPKAKLAYAWGGRQDRADSADEEPMVHIPVSGFVVLAKRPDAEKTAILSV
jgi:hypothetical protein